jgi:hypothetical protein
VHYSGLRCAKNLEKETDPERQKAEAKLAKVAEGFLGMGVNLLSGSDMAEGSPQSEISQRAFLWARGSAARETRLYLDRKGIDAEPLLSQADLLRARLTEDSGGISVASQHRFLERQTFPGFSSRKQFSAASVEATNSTEGYELERYRAGHSQPNRHFLGRRKVGSAANSADRVPRLRRTASQDPRPGAAKFPSASRCIYSVFFP